MAWGLLSLVTLGKAKIGVTFFRDTDSTTVYPRHLPPCKLILPCEGAVYFSNAEGQSAYAIYHEEVTE